MKNFGMGRTTQFLCTYVFGNVCVKFYTIAIATG